MRKACPAGRAFFEIFRQKNHRQTKCCAFAALRALCLPVKRRKMNMPASQSHSFMLAHFKLRFACCHRSLFWSFVWRSNANTTYLLPLGIDFLLAGANSAYAFGVSKYVRNRAYAKTTFKKNSKFHKLWTTFFWILAKIVVESRIF